MFTAIAIHIGVGLIHGNQPKACAELLDMSTTPHCCSPSKHGVYIRWPKYWFGDGSTTSAIKCFAYATAGGTGFDNAALGRLREP